MTKEFWKSVGIRALHTMAQTAIGVIGASSLISQVNWVAVASSAALAGIVSVLKSIAIGIPEYDPMIEQLPEE